MSSLVAQVLVWQKNIPCKLPKQAHLEDRWDLWMFIPKNLVLYKVVPRSSLS